MTNYEMVKSWGIEKMAVALMCPDEFRDDGVECRCSGQACVLCVIDWLKEEAK